MSYEYITANLRSNRTRRETLDGRQCLVVPTVMLVEGVLNGSQGPLLYQGADIAETTTLWDHRPIVLYHPQSGTAANPAVLNTRKLGIILNTRWDAPRLRTEAWLDIKRCNELDERIIKNLEAGKPVEVSTGLFTHNEMTAGVFNGKDYIARATKHRPDHLAVLPDQIGACSIADGAGLLALNAKNEFPPQQIGKIIDRIMTHPDNRFTRNALESLTPPILVGILMLASDAPTANQHQEYPRQYTDGDEPDLPWPSLNQAFRDRWESSRIKRIGGLQMPEVNKAKPSARQESSDDREQDLPLPELHFGLPKSMR